MRRYRPNLQSDIFRHVPFEVSMMEDPNGDWVKYSDVHARKTDSTNCSDEMLMAMLMDATYDRDEKFKEIDELKAKILRRMNEQH